MPDLDGKTAFQTGAGNASTGISGKTIIRHLDFTSMVSFEANKGRLGFLADYIYLNLGAPRSNPGSVTAGGAVLPPGAGSNLHLDVKGSLGLLAMSYRMGTTPRATMDLVGGARLIYLKERLDWASPATPLRCPCRRAGPAKPRSTTGTPSSG